MGWGSIAAIVLDKIPLERIIFREQNRSQDREDLKKIVDIINKDRAELAKSSQQTARIISIDAPKKVLLKRNNGSHSDVTTEETVNYQNREIAKLLLQIERHASQGMKINGRSCDCLIKHLPDLESLCEETISMVDNPDIYLKMIEWGKYIGPRGTPEANDSGLYTSEYPTYARQARNFRKEILGTLDYNALFQSDPVPEEKVKKEKPVKLKEPELPVEMAENSPNPIAAIEKYYPKPVENVTNNITEKLQIEAKEEDDVKENDENISESEIEDTPPIASNGTVCPDLKSMAEWLANEDEEHCHSCTLAITLPWYYEELEKLGDKNLIEELEVVQKTGIPVDIGEAMDTVKEKVPPEVKQRLLEFDCATQSFEQ
jgi:hypothetical protein